MQKSPLDTLESENVDLYIQLFVTYTPAITTFNRLLMDFDRTASTCRKYKIECSLACYNLESNFVQDISKPYSKIANESVSALTLEIYIC